MTWLYIPNSTASASAPDTEGLTSESDSAAKSWAQTIAQSCTARGKHTRRQTWLQKWRKARWTRLLSGPTCSRCRQEKLLSAWCRQTASSCCTEESRASRFPSPERKNGQATSGTCGLPSGALHGTSARFEKSSSSWKTCGGLFAATIPGLNAFWPTSPTQGGMRSGICFLRQRLERRTGESEFSSWHTPNVPSGDRHVPEDAQWSGKAAYDAAGKKCQVDLNNQVKNSWRTPGAGDGTNGGPAARDSSGALHLSAQAIGSWKTPHGLTATEGGGGEFAKQVKNWATPNTMDNLPERSREALDRQFSTTRKGRSAPANLREQVNPENWPTPASRDAKGANGENHFAEKERPHADQLPNAVLPAGGRRGRDRSNTAGSRPESWHTPSTEDNKTDGKKVLDRYGTDEMKTSDQRLRNQIGQTNAQKLNPDWVETLMGIPVGWTNVYAEFGLTDCACAETAWCRLLLDLLS